MCKGRGTALRGGLGGAGEVELDALGREDCGGHEIEVGLLCALEERMANCFRISTTSSSSSSLPVPPESDVADVESAPARPALSLNNFLMQRELIRV